MATINSPIRKFVKPLLFKILGKRGYVRFQTIGKIRDINQQLIDESEMDLYPFFLEDDSVSIDVGANYAYHTHRLATLCKKGKVYAFEPIPFTFQVCKRIVKHFMLKNVELFQYGVGERNEKISFQLPLQDFGVISAGQSHMGGRNNELEGKEKHYKFSSYEEVECEVVSIDTMKLNLNKLDFVKMDIEGAEYYALKGMIKTLKQFKPIVLLEINPFFLKGFGIEESSLRDLIEELGYLTYTYKIATKKLIRYESDYIEDNYYLIHNTKLDLYRHLIES